MRYILRDAIIFGCAAAITFYASSSRAQTTCMYLGDGITTCTNGSSSLRLGDLDLNSDGSWGVRMGGGMYLANPPANPMPDAPAYPPNDTQPWRPGFETWRPGKVPDRR